jgi:hypothetical protein
MLGSRKRIGGVKKGGGEIMSEESNITNSKKDSLKAMDILDKGFWERVQKRNEELINERNERRDSGLRDAPEKVKDFYTSLIAQGLGTEISKELTVEFFKYYLEEFC